jgi:small-conductance mechanosensitive channel
MQLDQIRQWLLMGERSISNEIASPYFYLQLGLIVACAAVAWATRMLLRSRFDAGSLAMGWPGPLRRLLRALIRSAPIAVFAALLLVLDFLMQSMISSGRSYLLPVAAKLALAWLAIRLTTSLIRNTFVVGLVSVLAWCVAVLSIAGQLQAVSAALDSVAIVLGDLRLTPLLLLKLTVLLALALWLSNLISQFLESRITRSHDLTPSMQVLLIKLLRVVLMVFAVALVLGAVGINLSALAIFSGAVGVGIGLGLQKIVANFISGIILLVDKSVKPGDLVTIGDSFGRINAMNTRYISIAAGDGREILIPNEDLVTQKVVNWTYTDKNALVKVKFGTNYDADPRLVCRLAVEVAMATPRVIDVRPPACLLTEFGDYGMQFVLTFWISEPTGMDNVRSDVMLALWDAFKREGIKVPYPVRDIRIRGGGAAVEAVTDAPG